MRRFGNAGMPHSLLALLIRDERVESSTGPHAPLIGLSAPAAAARHISIGRFLGSSLVNKLLLPAMMSEAILAGTQTRCVNRRKFNDFLVDTPLHVFCHSPQSLLIRGRLLI
ncbi:unnamed protein product [Soboliphyme baturini]|uniref:Secreted protein n=1 Tax=Soboliphyme baturini TaxID=241478 RepID=A0A183IE61_9BILA|nr:unnamed protein product [Soboliphyme baturini]